MPITQHLLLLTNPKTRVILCLPTDPALLQIAILTDASGYLPVNFALSYSNGGGARKNTHGSPKGVFAAGL
ncbi:MAG: hypothetical protein LH609_07350 [Rudanella sp.]|nr:hypothetical protein [Rudanella sp.]